MPLSSSDPPILCITQFSHDLYLIHLAHRRDFSCHLSHTKHTKWAKLSTSNSITATCGSTSPSFQGSIEVSPGWSGTCVCQLVWLTYHFKVIDSLMQDVWVSSYEQTDQSWSPIFRTIRLQQRDHWFRHFSVFLPDFLQLQSWLCVRVFWKRMIFCMSYMWKHVLMSLIIVTTKFGTVPVMSQQLVHINNCDLLL